MHDCDEPYHGVSARAFQEQERGGILLAHGARREKGLAVCQVDMLETYEYLETFETEKEKQQYLKEFEDAIFEQYKPVLKTFTRTQAKILIKLINRETHQSSFNIVKAFLGSFRAGFWQTFGRMFGVNMRSDYDPENNAEDAVIERICIRVETGLL